LLQNNLLGDAAAFPASQAPSALLVYLLISKFKLNFEYIQVSITTLVNGKVGDHSLRISLSQSAHFLKNLETHTDSI